MFCQKYQAQYNINRRPSQYKKNFTRSKAQTKRREYEKSSVRAKVAHGFVVVKGAVVLSTNAIPRAAKTDSQTEYDVRSGKSDFGRQTLTGGGLT